jgi:hypothetical protein
MAPIEVDLVGGNEDLEEIVDWSGLGLALPVDSEGATPQRPAVMAAFGKVPAGASRGARNSPYAASAELAEAAASVHAAEQLLASSPESSDGLPGGVVVKLEGASE